MVEREMKIARVVIISLITASLFVPLPGYAEETGGGCPKMQFGVVHDSQDALVNAIPVVKIPVSWGMWFLQ